jgi:hypothetical protein
VLIVGIGKTAGVVAVWLEDLLAVLASGTQALPAKQRSLEMADAQY